MCGSLEPTSSGKTWNPSPARARAWSSLIVIVFFVVIPPHLIQPNLQLPVIPIAVLGVAPAAPDQQDFAAFLVQTEAGGRRAIRLASPQRLVAPVFFPLAGFVVDVNHV